MSDRKWSAKQIPDQQGRLAIVTGANSGIGFETARVLAEHGADVILACRNAQKAEAAVAAIRADGARGSVEFWQLDLADLDSVRRFASDFLADHGQLDLLVNNAGVMMPADRDSTVQGFELQLGVNHLGHFLLTSLLMPALEAAVQGRVVSVASQAHRMGRIDFDDLQWESRSYRRMASYGQSKLANLLFAFELARKLAAIGSSVRSLAAHPGWTATDLQRHTPSARFFNGFFAMKPSQGALPTLRAALDPESMSGDYFGPKGVGELRGPPVKVGSSRRARKIEDAERLWRVSETLTGASFILERAQASA